MVPLRENPGTREEGSEARSEDSGAAVFRLNPHLSKIRSIPTEVQGNPQAKYCTAEGREARQLGSAVWSELRAAE